MNKASKIVTIKEKKLVGHSIEMSLTNNKNMALFSHFMANRKAIQNAIGTDIFEVMIYNDSHFKNFSPTNTFEKWATLEVSDYDAIPKDMMSLDIKGGLYVVFQYIGLPQGFGILMNYIFSEWFPKSKYTLDNRAHFNVLGKNYEKDSPVSEEEVWIPIKLK